MSNGCDNATSAVEKQRLLRLFDARYAGRAPSFLEDASFASWLQETTQKVADFLRTFVEVSPR